MATAVETWIRNTALTERRELFAYCVMPDHVHLIIEVDTRDQMSNFVSRLKNDVTRASKVIGAKHFAWQKGFWDSALYDAREYDGEVIYILKNPVRAGLVTAWHEYPHSFSVDIPRPQPNV